VLYESGPCLVAAKPGGLLTQAPPGIDSLEVRIKDYLRTRSGRGDEVYLGVPHRLDRPVSGALVVAKSRRAARRLAEQFQGRLVQKKYLALVEGRLQSPQGTWSDYVRKTPGEARAEITDRRAAGARPAVLHYRVVLFRSNLTWLEIELETGRMHQIRVQASARGTPIVGDELYGANRPFGPAREDPRERWIGLHARSLTFRHPKNRQLVSVAAPLPAAWTEFGLSETDWAESWLEWTRQ
jgi:RluA family pseudouridine synthase